MAENDVSALGIRMRRTRREKKLPIEKRNEIAARVIKFHDEIERSRDAEAGMREERIAKYRLLTSNSSKYPSDIALPDMLADSLRAQDGLMNAVLATRPMIASRALTERDKDKQENVDRLLDFQFFVENPGETILAEMAESFVNDGHYTVFLPQIKEEKEIRQSRSFDPIPPDAFPSGYFMALIANNFENAVSAEPLNEDAWDFRVETRDQTYRVSFYTGPDDSIEMVWTMQAEIFNGPRPIVKQWQDVLHPVRAANLQPPGPSNPGGAEFVILRDYPGIDEIKRLVKSGYYDISDDEMKKLEALNATDWNPVEEQKDFLAGQTQERNLEHKKLTRLLCFDMYDMGDGFATDMIFWVIKETGTLLKMKRLSEMYPVNPPRRPLVRQQYLPVQGRATGIGLLEIMEPMHDLTKAMFDQAIDNGTLSTFPFGFYRAAGGIRPETIRLDPGELYPLADPQRDVNFPYIRNDSTGFALNMMTMAGQYQEKATMIGDMSYGRVPAGKSSALRTSGNMGMLQMQAEARPERVLRRFFSGLAEIYRQMHELNEQFLPRGKSIRVMKMETPDDNPFMEIKGPEEISGRFQFDFSANVFNTSRQALQESLMQLMQVYVTPLALQAGVITPDGIYRLMKDIGKAWGQDAMQYLTAPSPEAMGPVISFEQALHTILMGEMPEGTPAEGPQAHLEKLMEAAQSGIMEDPQTPGEAAVQFRNWVMKVNVMAKEQAQRQQLIAAAGQMQNGGGQAGRPAESVQGPGPNPQISGPSELLDESLPTAGGGA